ncbi:MAG: hypothetical protein LBT65_01790 [Synergistaceae bacterium]|nr:hypothetical protein [Synergistaceae bacterium]
MKKVMLVLLTVAFLCMAGTAMAEIGDIGGIEGSDDRADDRGYADPRYAAAGTYYEAYYGGPGGGSAAYGENRPVYGGGPLYQAAPNVYYYPPRILVPAPVYVVPQPVYTVPYGVYYGYPHQGYYPPY